MPDEKQTPKGLKITDKRMFTADGEVREEFQNEIQPPQPHTAAPEPPAPAPEPEKKEATQPPRSSTGERRRPAGEPPANPGTPFANFLQSLIAQTYMFLGMIRDPRAPQPIYEPQAARETIDILTLLREKTTGNLTPEEEDFFDTHLGDLKLAYVQRTKSI